MPVQCEYLALEGLTQLITSIELVRRGLNPDLEIEGLVMTMFDSRTHLSQQVVDEVRRHFGEQVYQTLVPRSVRLSEAPSFGQPGIVYAPTAPGAQAYRALAAELIAHNPPVAGIRNSLVRKRLVALRFDNASSPKAISDPRTVAMPSGPHVEEHSINLPGIFVSASLRRPASLQDRRSRFLFQTPASLALLIVPEPPKLESNTKSNAASDPSVEEKA